MYNEICKITNNNRLVQNIFELEFQSEQICSTAKPGQFVHLKVNSGLYPLMRRPISIHSLNKAGGTVSIVYHVVGQGTEELSKLSPGDEIDVIGPLGKGFPLLEGKRLAVVGGGIGTAPLLELAKELPGCDAYLGYRDCVYKIKDFQDSCNKVFVTTEDGSAGRKGYVTSELQNNILSYDVVYTCGPKPMLKAVMDICSRNNVECYVSLEERMGCGIGACLVCACKIMGEDGQWHHKKACKDGPVFNAREVVFDE